jgi:ankyrin repeat protein
LQSIKMSEEILEAAREGQTEQVRRLIQEGVNVNVKGSNGNTPLHNASCRGHVDTVRYLLDSGANVNVKGWNGYTPLIDASWNGALEVVGILLDNGASVNDENDYGETALHCKFVDCRLNGEQPRHKTNTSPCRRLRSCLR